MIAVDHHDQNDVASRLSDAGPGSLLPSTDCCAHKMDVFICACCFRLLTGYCSPVLSGIGQGCSGDGTAWGNARPVSVGEAIPNQCRAMGAGRRIASGKFHVNSW